MALRLFLLFSLLCLSSGSAISRNHSILDLDLDMFTSQEQVSSLFQLWKKEHGRVYQNQEEEAKRLEIFQRNLNYIREKNANRKSTHAHRLGLNKFADMSPEEFSKTYLQAPKQVSPPINLGNSKKLKQKEDSCCANAPACWDWRKKGVVTEVKDQGKCGGGGWAFATVGAIESINAIVTRNLVSLSEQELIDCVSSNNGCDVGWTIFGYEWVVENGGISAEADYPYTGQKGTCKANMTQDKVTIDGYALEGLIASPNATELEIEGELMCRVRKQPISVAVDAQSIQFYTSGIFYGDDNCTSLDHRVLVVGYDSVDCEDYWIVKNSWGQDWGMNGYIYIGRNIGNPLGVCGINVFATYPIKEYPELATTVLKKGIAPLFEARRST